MNDFWGGVLALITGVLSVFGLGQHNAVLPQSQTEVVQVAPSAAQPQNNSTAHTSIIHATIDQSSLTQEVTQDGSPVITGTVSNTDKISLYISGFHNLVHSGNTSGLFRADPAVNGRWSITLPNSNIEWSPGTYQVEVQDAQGNVLTSGTLTVSLPVTVDKNSLTATAGNVTITGTAPNARSIDVVLFQSAEPRSQVANGTVSVVDGRWSYTAPLAPGAYNIWILDATKPIEWSSDGNSLLEGSLLGPPGYDASGSSDSVLVVK